MGSGDSNTGCETDARLAYLYPNDNSEIERLEDQYNIIKMVLDNRSYLTPWSQQNPPHRVLDIATGTGTWCVDIGDEFPRAQIIGTDLSPIQHQLVPPNVQFIIDDACVWSHLGECQSC